MNFPSFTFTQLPNDLQSIGETTEIICEITTDLSALSNCTYYFKPALFTILGQLLGETLANPGSATYVYSTTPATALNTDFEMVFGGSADKQIGRAGIKFTKPAAVIVITLRLGVLLQHDYKGYASGQTYTNQQKLLKNEFQNVFQLNNTTISAYRFPKSVRFALWAKELGVYTFVVAESAAVNSLRFYNKGLLDLPMERVTDQTVTLKRNGFPVGGLSVFQDTELVWSITLTPGVSPTGGKLYLINVSANNDQVYFIDSYQLRYAKIELDPAPFVPGSSLPAFNLSDPSPNVFKAPATSLTNTTGDEWQFSLTINKNLLVAGATYRLIFIPETDDGATLISYSLISDALLVCSSIALDLFTVPELFGVLSDYLNDFGNHLVVTPKERIQSMITVDPARYDAVHSISFRDALKSIKVRFYAYESATVINVFGEQAVIRQPNGSFTAPVNIDFDLTTLVLRNVFRIRYEDNLPGMFNILLPANTMVSSSTNQDWSGRTVYVQTQFFLQPATPWQEILTFTQILEVKEFYEDMSATFTIDGNSVQMFCQGDGNLDICVSDPNAQNGDYSILTIEPLPTNMDTLQESDPNAGGGALEDLDSQYVSLHDGVFLDFQSCAQLKEVELLVNERYSICFIRKGTPIPGCGDGQAAGGSGSENFTFNVGQDTGDMIVALQTYGFDSRAQDGNTGCNGLDGIGFDWNSNWDQTTNNATGCPAAGSDVRFTVSPFQYGDGVLVLNKTAATPTTVEVVVEAYPGAPFSQFWFKLFCPTARNELRPYLADSSQMRPQTLPIDVLLHEEAFLFEWDGTQDFKLFYTSPGGSYGGVAVYYRFAIFYNGVEVDASTDGTFTYVGSQSSVLSFPKTSFVVGQNYMTVIITLNPMAISTSFPPPGFQAWYIEPRYRNANTAAITNCANQYIYPLPTSLDDNNSATQCFPVPERIECRSDLSYCKDLFNNNLCGNDGAYFQPVLVSNPNPCNKTGDPGGVDLIYFQFQLPDKFNDWDGTPTHGWHFGDGEWFIEIGLADGCCNKLPFDLTANVVSAWVGERDGARMQTIVINPLSLPKCFQFYVNIFEANDLCGSFYTEPYKKVDCEETLLVEGVYPSGFDCEGAFYELPDHILTTIAPPLPYRNVYRIPGELTIEGFNFNKVSENNTYVGSTLTDKYRLRTPALPQYVAEQLLAIFNAPHLIINGDEYQFTGDVNRNNESGKMWYLELELTRIRCNVDYKCYVS